MLPHYLRSNLNSELKGENGWEGQTATAKILWHSVRDPTLSESNLPREEPCHSGWQSSPALGAAEGLHTRILKELRGE